MGTIWSEIHFQKQIGPLLLLGSGLRMTAMHAGQLGLDSVRVARRRLDGRCAAWNANRLLNSYDNEWTWGDGQRQRQVAKSAARRVRPP